MITRLEGLCIILAIVIAFAVGRYSVSENKSETKQTETQKQQDKHKETTTVIVKAPDGTQTTTTKTVEDTVTDTKQLSKSKDTESRPSIVSISALMGVDTANGRQTVYGLAVSKEVAGPLILGAYGMNNGIIGLSIGVNF